MTCRFLICLIVFGTFGSTFSQGSPDYEGGLNIAFDENGKKYLRIISWAQVQAIYNGQASDEEEQTSFNLARARILMFSQINEKFLILTHFGLNNLNSNSMSPTGLSDASELFFHGVWAQYNLGKRHSVGAGLHYFNGISRLNNQSTLNIMTLDNNRQSWSTVGLSDQFGRHLGIYAKGSLGKLQYRVAINDAITNGLDDRDPQNGGSAVYAGKRLLGSADSGKVFSGYFEYSFFDMESDILPYKVGTYLGGKRIFNLGVGFFTHPSGSVRADVNGVLEPEDVRIFAVDAFYDAPWGDDGSAITAYATYQHNDYGEDYFFLAYGTGNMAYGHLGYLLPGSVLKTRFQPYASYALNTYDAFENNRTIFGIGANTYFSGHNSKLTLEYRHESFGDDKLGTVTLQAMIYL
ncbi:hypothetical protein [Ulvibacterium sp.]|uniref:hypothetical protein n=1 Tax=Ulvibacterium sp. TaxID=2665914 RepID=UPI00260C34F2|nr:hypothetical protein [Ulvibacterium sp.]